MATKELELRTKAAVPSNVRWLAAATGCLTAVASVLVMGVFVVVPGLLVVGAIVAGRLPRVGKYVIWFGAIPLSLLGLPLGASMLLIHLQPGSDPRVVAGVLSSVALVVLCDVALIVEELKTRHTLIGAGAPSPNAGDWLVWIAAAFLNLGFLPITVLGLTTYRGEGRRDILFSLVLGSLVILFDVLLAILAFNTRRARHTAKTNIDPGLL